MRLIDADALKDGICKECTLYGTQDCAEKIGGECDWDIIGHINEAPAIDAVEVVRCKDCIESERSNGELVCGVFCCSMGDNDFCAAGKKSRRKLSRLVFEVYGMIDIKVASERMKNPRVWTNDEYVEIANPTDIDEITEALRFKAEHITAKADPQVFELAAKTIEELFDTACYWKGKADEVSEAKDEDDLK